MSCAEKGKARENPARARKVARKAKRVKLGKVTVNREWDTRDLMVSVEIAENTVTRLLIVGTSSSTNHKAKVKARASKSKSNVTEISESDASQQAEETWSPNTSLQPSSLSQVNAFGEIGRAGDGWWTFSVGDSQKRRYSVNWTVGTDVCEFRDLRPGRRARFGDQFWMLRTFLPTLVRTPILLGEFFKR